ncbi:hypothetical protein TRFO_24535 [Tritrichomonas foetus]|uniref:Uncharacterized protein n=1 Tax=Tritrichomonas foetus TaxID=1144522 RepID=A0A1J4K816_9EUKA|nr:hypothetical protein TRFO_24535 [Tritrichomonas foetus]|eukprot:OHT07347.1 hypothetical protein TRFO_24535 [Tritrichomonas foetus]
MFRFNKAKTPGPAEIKLNSNQKLTIHDIIECEDLPLLLRDKDPKLIGFLLDHENVKVLYDMLMQAKEKKVHKTIMSLYQTSNTCLHRLFADSIDLSEYALRCLTSDGDEMQYAMGTFSRIISRGFDNWPHEMWQVLRYTNGAINTIISNIDKSCISQAISDLFSTKHYPWICQFMWLLFLAFVSPNKANEYKKDRPRFILFSDIDESDVRIESLHQNFTNEHKQSAEALFIQFFSADIDYLEEFHSQFFDYVATEEKEFTPRLFKIVRQIGPNEKVKDRALNLIKEAAKSQKFDTQTVSYCSEYLSVCSTILDMNTSLNIIFTLINTNSHQFTLFSMLQFVQRIEEDKPNWLQEFQNLMISFVAYSWNNNVSNEDAPMLIDILLSIGKTLKVDLSKWKEFGNNIKSWGATSFIETKDDRIYCIDYDFRFDQDFYDEAKIKGYMF